MKVVNQNILSAKHLLNTNSEKVEFNSDFYKFFTPQNPKKPEIHGGFAVAYYDGSVEVEEMLKKDLRVTVRCIPLDTKVEAGAKCIFTGKDARALAIFAKSY